MNNKRHLLFLLVAFGIMAVAFNASADEVFKRNLYQGMKGSDIKSLQQILNKSYGTKIATTGSGSPGKETTFFGEKTKKALIIYQNYNFLGYGSPLTAFGYVEETTRKVLNAMVNGTYVPPTGAPDAQDILNQTYAKQINVNSPAPVITSVSSKKLLSGGAMTIYGRNFSTSTNTVRTAFDEFKNIPSKNNSEIEIKIESLLQKQFDEQTKDMKSKARENTLGKMPQIPLFITVETEKGLSNPYQIFFTLK